MAGSLLCVACSSEGSTFDCLSYQPDGYDQTTGSCKCPDGMAPCTREEAAFRSPWLLLVTEPYVYSLSQQIVYLTASHSFRAYDMDSGRGSRDLCSEQTAFAFCKGTPWICSLSGPSTGCLSVQDDVAVQEYRFSRGPQAQSRGEGRQSTLFSCSRGVWFLGASL